MCMEVRKEKAPKRFDVEVYYVIVMELNLIIGDHFNFYYFLLSSRSKFKNLIDC